MRALFLALPLLALVACNDDEPTDLTDSTDSTDSTDDTDVVDETSLTDDVMPVFAANCAGCHQRVDGNEGATANGVYFEENGDILGKVGTFIQAGDSANSGLLKVMAGEMQVGAGPSTMPPRGTVEQEDLDTVAAWIDEGAKDN